MAGDLFSYAPAWDPANDWHLVLSQNTTIRKWLNFS
jgi:hypothetical protein